MNMLPTKVELQIIQAAVECIEKFGLTGVTNRRIAEIAGVSNASINYYFRTKKNLIKKVMDITLHVAFDWEKLESTPGTSANDRCIAIFENMIKGGLNYPGIMRAHFYELVSDVNYDSLVETPYNEFMVRLCQDLSARGSELSLEELQLACTQIASACFMVILAPKINAFSVDVFDEEKRHLFVSRLVNRLLKTYP
jgi:TetR/AcrR family transcriptional regulator, regulator of cefoperazone and chloramphenicol sensitivity